MFCLLFEMAASLTKPPPWRHYSLSPSFSSQYHGLVQLRDVDDTIAEILQVDATKISKNQAIDQAADCTTHGVRLVQDDTFSRS